MRILGMTELWPKLTQDTWTTFRFARKDQDWEVGEVVQVVYKPRSRKDDKRAILGIAEIVGKELRWAMFPDEGFIFIRTTDYPEWDHIPFISETESMLDGFRDRMAMFDWLIKSYDVRVYDKPMNCLSLRWKQVWLNLPGSQAPDTMRKWAKMQRRPEECGIEPPILTIGESFLGGCHV